MGMNRIDSTIDTLFKKEHCSGHGQRNLLFEVGSVSSMGMNRIDRCESEVEFTVVTYVIRSKTTNANDNFAPSEFALAA